MRTLQGETKTLRVESVEQFPRFELVNLYCMSTGKFLYRTCVDPFNKKQIVDTSVKEG